jgi:hypothetical protein
MQRTASFTLLFAVAAACLGCQTHVGKLSAVDFADGVSQSEAMTIAQCYSDKYLGRGEISSIEDGGDHWLAVGKLGGYLAKPLSFSIDKRSGKITSQGGPDHETPYEPCRPA